MSRPMKKRFLFVMQRGPHGGCYAREALDLLLTSAAFEQEVSVLLLDEGVFLIKSGQRPERINSADIAQLFLSFDIYDVQPLYVEQDSLSERGIEPEGLILPVTLVPRSGVGELISRHDRIVGC
jgi:tRNA 2-thiouridine synthesizing protein C